MEGKRFIFAWRLDLCGITYRMKNPSWMQVMRLCTASHDLDRSASREELTVSPTLVLDCSKTTMVTKEVSSDHDVIAGEYFFIDRRTKNTLFSVLNSIFALLPTRLGETLIDRWFVQSLAKYFFKALALFPKSFQWRLLRWFWHVHQCVVFPETIFVNFESYSVVSQLVEINILQNLLLSQDSECVFFLFLRDIAETIVVKVHWSKKLTLRATHLDVVCVTEISFQVNKWFYGDAKRLYLKRYISGIPWCNSVQPWWEALQEIYP